MPEHYRKAIYQKGCIQLHNGVHIFYIYITLQNHNMKTNRANYLKNSGFCEIIFNYDNPKKNQ